METNFFKDTENVREEIYKNVSSKFTNLENDSIKDILLQRQKTSSYLKGITSYLIHNGLSGPLNHGKNIDLASAIETYSTGLVILDNIIDSHKIRNNETTYLEEHGLQKNILAANYAIHLGLLDLAPFLNNLTTSKLGIDSDFLKNSLEGILLMDIEKPTDSLSILDSISKVNGNSLSIPLAITASNATNDMYRIGDILNYANDTGIAFGLHEEIRDLIGEHGRNFGTEISSGRTPYSLSYLNEKEPSLNLKEYIGKNLSKKDKETLINILKNRGAFKHTQKLIHRHLDYGIDRLKMAFSSKEELVILESLNDTIKKDLTRFIEK